MAKALLQNELDVSWINLNDPVSSLRNRLETFSDVGYARYVKRSLPKESCDVLGLPTPLIRETVKEAMSVDGAAFLNAALFPKKYYRTRNERKVEKPKKIKPNFTLEERLALSFILGALKLSFDERMEAFEAFLPLVDSWAICDTLCGAYKPKPDEKAELWHVIGLWLKSDKPYTQRVALVLMLKYYLTRETINEVLVRVEELAQKGIAEHTVSMAVAWLLCEAFIKRPVETQEYVDHNSLDDATFNRMIQKICDSLRVDAETKKDILAMKRYKNARRKE